MRRGQNWQREPLERQLAPWYRMNGNTCLAALSFTVLLACGEATFSKAAEEKKDPPASQASTKAIAELPEVLAQLETEPLKKVESLRTLVEQEAEANRISAPIAQSLRWTLRSSRVVTGGDLRGLLTTVRVPQDNAALTEGFKDLETMYNAAQTRRGILVRNASEALRIHTGELVRVAKTPEEVDAVIQIATAARDAFLTRGAGEFYPEQNIFTNALVTLRALKRLIEAEQASDQTALASAVTSFRSSAQSDREMVPVGDISARIDRTLKRFEAAAAEARAALDAAIAARKPRTELIQALGRFERAAEQMNGLRLQPSTNELRALAHVYGGIVDALSALDLKDLGNAEQKIAAVRSSLSGLNVDERTKVEALLSESSDQIDTAIRKRSSDRKETVRVLLTEVAGPKDLEAVLARISEWTVGSATKGDRDANVWPALMAELQALASIWSSSNAALLERREEADVRVGSPHMFSAELRAIRERIERDVLSKTLRLPELLDPPLAQLPPDAAIERVCRDLAQRSDWRRMYEVIHARESMRRGRGDGRPDETLAALRSFMAGQNFELAEQWADAVAAYKLVLQTVSDLAPTQAAAERLKVLAKEHPDVMRKSAAPEPGAIPSRSR
jgi:hypothetical protein